MNSHLPSSFRNRTACIASPSPPTTIIITFGDSLFDPDTVISSGSRNGEHYSGLEAKDFYRDVVVGDARWISISLDPEEVYSHWNPRIPAYQCADNLG